MADRSAIEWTDATWNPLVGCTHVSPGCDHCYAARQASGRLRDLPVYSGLAVDGRFTGEVRYLPERLEQPLRWRRPRRIFVNSMGDLFHRDVLAQMHLEGAPFLAEVFAVMAMAKRHTFQVLTKRPQLMAAVLTTALFRLEVNAALLRRGVSVMPGGFDSPWPPNMWLGTSIESDAYAWRADHVRDTPAALRWLSLEPLLGPLPSLDLTDIDWVVVGGESGPSARPMHPAWARDIRDQCVAAGIPFHFKQWGAWEPVEPVYVDDHDDVLLDGYDDVDVVSFNRSGQVEQRLPGVGRPQGHQPNPAGEPWWMAKVGARAAGRELDGRTWDQYPGAALAESESLEPAP